MAGGKLNNTRVKASTILEVVIAMVIILLIFSMAMMMFTNVMRSSLSVKKIKAEAILQETLIKAEQNKENSTQTFTVDDLSIVEEIKPYDNNPALVDIHLTAYDTNRQKVGEVQKVMMNKND